MIRLVPAPPVSEMEIARESLSHARKNRADTYSRRQYNQAKIYYDSALANWQRENNRFIYFRNYERVSEYARLSLQKANEASENSKSSKTSLQVTVKQKIETLNSLVSDINKIFTTYPLSPEIRNRISKGKMLLKESEIAFKKEHYLEADRKLTDSEYLLTTSYESASSDLKNYFNSFPVWKAWIDKTINESRRNRTYSIIVDKFSRKVIVYLNGVKKYEYTAELGKNWVGDKRVKGDKATPEGMYKITKKIDRGRTKYYKALLLDYPNTEDTMKFKDEIEKGSLPPNSKIGGLIEIHGNGGKGIDWTEGCIALTDKEMDVIFKITKVGTPVTIVGSMYQLEHVMNR